MLNSASANEKTEPLKKRGRKPKTVQETSEIKENVTAISDGIKDVNTVPDAEKTIKPTSGSDDKPLQSTEIVDESFQPMKKKAGRPKKAIVATETENAKESSMVEGESSNTEAVEQVQPKKRGRPKKVVAEVALNTVMKNATNKRGRPKKVVVEVVLNTVIKSATKTDDKTKAAANSADSNSESSEAKEAVDSDYEPEKKVNGGKEKVVKEKKAGSDYDVKPEKVTKKVAKSKVALDSIAKPSEKTSDESAVASKQIVPKPVKEAQSKKAKKTTIKKPPADKKKIYNIEEDEQEKQENGPGTMDATYDV